MRALSNLVHGIERVQKSSVDGKFAFLHVPAQISPRFQRVFRSIHFSQGIQRCLRVRIVQRHRQHFVQLQPERISGPSDACCR